MRCRFRIPQGTKISDKSRNAVHLPLMPWACVPCRTLAIAAVELTPVAMVNVVVPAAPPAGVTDDGEKLQVECSGSPEQANVIADAKPKFGVAVMVVVALLPLVTEREVELRARLKLGVPTVTLTTAEVEAEKIAPPPY